jgi:hypothetical protein
MVDQELSFYPIPEDSSAEVIDNALESIRACSDKESSTRAYHRILYAVGNNHAGIYHPVAVPVVRRLGELLADDNVWARRVALDSLIDLSSSFFPDPQHYTMLLSDGTTTHTETALHAAVRSLRGAVCRIVSNPRSEKDEASLAAELLEWIDGR